MASNLYQSLPANSIRILDLLPGENLDPVVVEMHAVAISDSGEYEALSYTWGDLEAGSQTVICNGQNFKVTANLYAALRRLRKVKDMRRIWIDAICINQDSVEERTQQVQLMLEIYKNANQVQIWIGEATEDDDIELLFKVADQRYSHALKMIALDFCPSTLMTKNMIDSIPLLIHSTDAAVLDIFRGVARRMKRVDVMGYMQNTSKVLAALGDKSPDPSYMWIGLRALPAGFRALKQPVVEFPKSGSLDIEYIRRVAEKDWTDFEAFFSEAMRPPESNLCQDQMNRVVLALCKFFERQYWQRAWIVQEILASRKAVILCGQHEVTFESFSNVYTTPDKRSKDVHVFFGEDFSEWYPLSHSSMAGKVEMDILARGHCHPSGTFGLEIPEEISVLDHMRGDCKSKDKVRFTLAFLSRQYRARKAKDPRDIIFSLVGVLRQWSRYPKIIDWCKTAIDYSKDTRAVFLDAAAHVVESYNHSESTKPDPNDHILQLFSASKNASLDLPSWVPDWTSKREGVLFDTKFPSGLVDVLPYRARVEQDSLFLSGHTVDTVAFVSEELDNSLDNNGMYSEVEWFKHIIQDLGLGKIYGDYQMRSEAFWRTIIADDPTITLPWIYSYGLLRSQDPDTNLTKIKEWVKHAEYNYNRISQLWSSRLEYRASLGPFLKTLHNAGIDPTSKLPVEGYWPDVNTRALIEIIGMMPRQDPDPEWASLQKRSMHAKHRFLVTEKGYFGLCPTDVNCDDTVVVFGGAVAPWFLRKVDNHYKLLGPGFVHGLMYKHDKYYESGLKEDDIEMIELR